MPPLTEEALPPTTTADFEVGPITETPSADGTAIFVEGSVRNVGSRTSRELVVWVTALDATGRPIARQKAAPEPQAVPPGEDARFVTRLPNDPAIRTFHVEAVGR